MHTFLTIARTTWTETRRSRVATVCVLAMAAAAGMALFLSQVAIAEVRETQATLAGTLLRATAVFITATFVVSAIVRELQERVVELILSRPVSRSTYVLGKVAGFSVACAALCLALFFAAALVSLPMAAAAWSASLFVELLVVACASVFCSLALGQFVASLATVAGAYLLSRSISALGAVAASPLAREPGWVDHVMQGVAVSLDAILPPLDRMADSAWLASGPPAMQDWLAPLAQSAVFAALLVAGTLVDFYRKNF
jgi:Cu-processing system permease protein